jgi:hypothetical protein
LPISDNSPLQIARFSVSVKNQCIFGSYHRLTNLRTHKLFNTSKPKQPKCRQIDSQSSTFVWLYGPDTILAYSMEQSHSCEANRFTASQEITRILWNLKFHYHIHKFPPPVSILGQLNPIYNPDPTS